MRLSPERWLTKKSNVGNDVKALIRHWKTDLHFSSTQGPERLHVSIISLANFAGRLVSGESPSAYP